MIAAACNAMILSHAINFFMEAFMKRKEWRVLLLAVFIFCVSCTTYTYNRKDPYPNMEILSYANSQAYVFPSDKSDKLIIMLEGSGWSSVLGIKENNIWTSVQYGSQLLQELNEGYTFLIPEKLRRQPGEVYFEDVEDRANYTSENLIACYTESINSFLEEHDFASIVLIGTSEGAMLLPIIYENMNDKDKVAAMVSISFGGISVYESYNILSKRTNLPQGWFQMYFNMSKIFKPSSDETFDSFEENYYLYTFRWYNSMMHIRPFDYIKRINIPVLFVHGEADFNIPVESTRYIQENLPDKPFEYKYYHWDHQPGNKEDLLIFRKDIAEWIMNKTL